MLQQKFITQFYILGFFGSFLIQSLTQTKFGRESKWGINRGWQTEIAIWNVFAIIVLSATLLKGFESELVMLALFVMSLGFGVNHLLALRGGSRKSNVAGAVANFLGLIMILAWYFGQR